MTSHARARPAPARMGSWLGSGAVLAALAAFVAVRALATRAGLDALAIGAAFGLALSATWVLGGARPAIDGLRRPAWRGAAFVAAVGLAFGLALVAVTKLGAMAGGVSLPSGLARPAAPFAAWAVVTVVVAAAEEGILRGVLFDRLRLAGGTTLAIAVTTVAFVLLHVPLYGWHVVPLDVAVGLGFAGLRLSTRTVLAPALAHAVADLATWWL